MHIHEAVYNLLAPFLAELQASFRALESHPYNTFASYDPCGSGCSLASPFQNILCYPFYVNFKTVAKIVFFIQATLRCIGGLRSTPGCAGWDRLGWAVYNSLFLYKSTLI